MRRISAVACVLTALLWFLSPQNAWAHETSVAYLEVHVDNRNVLLTVRIAAQDVAVVVGMSPLQRPTKEQVLTRAERAHSYFAQRVQVTQSSRQCVVLPQSTAIATIDDPAQGSWRLVLTQVLQCPRVIDVITLRDDLFFDLDDNHRDFASITAFGTTRDKVFGNYDRQLTIDGNPQTFNVIKAYAVLGIEHIFTGYDHLAFLCALLLLLADPRARGGVAASTSFRPIRSVLWVVSGFTLAHSITLALAALHWVHPPTRWVECTIAFSIGAVALHDLRTVARPTALSVRFRPWIAFAFGLVHGLGFAGALGELGLPQRAMVRGLIAFNLGVECGQLTIAALFFPSLLFVESRLARHNKPYRIYVLLPASVGLLVLSAYWLVQRVRT